MEKGKKSNFLYFNSQELEKENTENKQVFITKRLKGKETHNIKKQIKLEDKKENEDLFIDIPVVRRNLDDSKNKKDIKTIKKQPKKTPKSKNNKQKTIKKNQEKNNKKIKNKKNKLKKKNIIVRIILSIIILLSVVIFIFITPIFNINEIVVNGNEKVSKETIISLSRLNKGENIFKNIKKDIIENIKENTYIENVEIKRNLPNTIEIEVKERKAVYQIQILDSFIYIDKNGYILEKSTEKEDAIFLEKYTTKEEDIIKNKRLDNADLIKLNDVQKIIVSFNSTEINKVIEKINIEDSKNYILYIKNVQIYIGDNSNLSKKMGYAQMILEDIGNESGLIFINGDFNNGFKPYFRPN